MEASFLNFRGGGVVLVGYFRPLRPINCLLCIVLCAVETPEVHKKHEDGVDDDEKQGCHSANPS